MGKMKHRTVGFAITGSFCTYEKIKEVLRGLVKSGNRVIPIFSNTAQTVNCRFGDVSVIAPCTGNTMAKLCSGVTDSPVLMAAKAHMRNEKPVVISVSTNDALGVNLKNIGELMNSKNIYFVPFGQDDFAAKPKSMIAHVDLIEDTIEEALNGRQIQPVIQSPF